MKEFMLLIRNKAEHQKSWSAERHEQFVKKCEAYIGNIRKRALRFTGVLLVGIGVIGFVVLPFFPMHLRGAERTLTDTMHKILTGVTVFFILLAIGFGATAYGKRFRLYSFGTILLILVFGALAGLDAPRVEAQLPTPWLGVTERVTIYAYLLWVLVLAITLLCDKVPQSSRLG